MDPIIKWAGGKGRMLEHILPLVPPDLPIIEPFAGGAALTFALNRPGGALADACVPLIETYKALRDGSWRLLVTELKTYEAKHSKALYYRTRDFFNAGADGDALRAATAFLYLNKAGFNGLWRVNKSGGYNVPWGKRTQVSFDFENLRKVREFLQTIELYAESMPDVMEHLASPQRCFWYFDPPYFQTFSSHVAKGFGEAQHRELAAQLDILTLVGAPWLLSHCESELYRELYSEEHFEIIEVQVQRSIAAKSGARGKATELLIRPREV